MKRKEFIKVAALTGGYLTTSGVTRGENISIMNNSNEISAAELQQFLSSLKPIKTCNYGPLKPITIDGIIIGDPETKIKKIGTCWMPY